jgi:hypothetical protein
MAERRVAAHAGDNRDTYAWPPRPPPALQVDVDGNPWPLDAAGNPILK